ncbi:MAG: hypothetical protein ACUVX9_10625 [Anaerolineae bacterium]
MPVLRDWNLEIDVDMVLRGQGADPVPIRARRPALVQIAEDALALGMPLLQPAVVFRELCVQGLRHETLELEGGASLRGPLVAEQLAGAQRLLVLVCTVGPALEQRASEVMAEDPLLGLALEGVGSAGAEALATAACHHFEVLSQGDGLYATLPLNPGIIGWPVEQGQQQVFDVLDASAIGVTLTRGVMMMPRKSLSLVLGFRRDPPAAARPCDFCLMRESCRQRNNQALSANQQSGLPRPRQRVKLTSGG